MAALPQNSTIQHFTHPKHTLTLFDSHTKYLCDGCKIHGIGKRYRCHGCDFDLHEHCGTCPMNLSSFLHPDHSLKLVVCKQPHGNRQFNRICNVCCDSVEGMYYRCELCDFDVHPLCTQLPETLRHALHQAHPLRLMGSAEPGTCAVCRGACGASSWRYRCALCGFDIHIGCVLIQCEKRTTTDQGIPTYVPPSVFPQQQYLGGYAYAVPYWHPNNMTQSQPQQQYFGGYAYAVPYWHPNYMPQSQPQHQNHGQPQTHYGGGGIAQVMFDLVKRLGIGVFSNMIFGTDLSSLFAA
ncbi:protein VACUOLELESS GAMETOPHYTES-like [Lycium ferocissimum]|uniref:protein VACUOLELESS GAMETOPHYTES-like n=1 Tax=Lycium ferocissimum TaxID=112874 RepID=UPI002815CE3A|nr:protein VACUOLELESS GAMETOPHYTES-like [Lycium ferocissimum]